MVMSHASERVPIQTVKNDLMAVIDVIRDLEEAQEPSRKLDVALAMLIGYKRKVENVRDPNSGEQTRRVLWLHPGGQDPGRVPRYTAVIDDACAFAQMVAPDLAGGVSWDSRGGYAKIGDGPYCSAASPAIALCIAALKILQSGDTDG